MIKVVQCHSRRLQHRSIKVVNYTLHITLAMTIAEAAMVAMEDLQWTEVTAMAPMTAMGMAEGAVVDTVW